MACYNNRAHNSTHPTQDYEEEEEWCDYCGEQNHHQEDCQERITNREPCTDINGQDYWPECTYCGDYSHQQEECQDRYTNQDPCTDIHGQEYWPECTYCSNDDHHQDNCQERIIDNQPATNWKTGQTYWPQNPQQDLEINDTVSIQENCEYCDNPYHHQDECDAKMADEDPTNTTITCFYCGKKNHHQDECRRRIKDNQPCRNDFGIYWPKIATTQTEDEEECPFTIKDTNIYPYCDIGSTQKDLEFINNGLTQENSRPLTSMVTSSRLPTSRETPHSNGDTDHNSNTACYKGDSDSRTPSKVTSSRPLTSMVTTSRLPTSRETTHNNGDTDHNSNTACYKGDSDSRTPSKVTSSRPLTSMVTTSSLPTSRETTHNNDDTDHNSNPASRPSTSRVTAHNNGETVYSVKNVTKSLAHGPNVMLSLIINMCSISMAMVKAFKEDIINIIIIIIINFLIFFHVYPYPKAKLFLMFFCKHQKSNTTTLKEGETYREKYRDRLSRIITFLVLYTYSACMRLLYKACTISIAAYVHLHYYGSIGTSKLIQSTCSACMYLFYKSCIISIFAYVHLHYYGSVRTSKVIYNFPIRSAKTENKQPEIFHTRGCRKKKEEDIKTSHSKNYHSCHIKLYKTPVCSPIGRNHLQSNFLDSSKNHLAKHNPPERKGEVSDHSFVYLYWIYWIQSLTNQNTSFVCLHLPTPKRLSLPSLVPRDF